MDLDNVIIFVNKFWIKIKNNKDSKVSIEIRLSITNDRQTVYCITYKDEEWFIKYYYK